MEESGQQSRYKKILQAMTESFRVFQEQMQDIKRDQQGAIREVNSAIDQQEIRRLYSELKMHEEE